MIPKGFWYIRYVNTNFKQVSTLEALRVTLLHQEAPWAQARQELFEGLPCLRGDGSNYGALKGVLHLDIYTYIYIYICTYVCMYMYIYICISIYCILSLFCRGRITPGIGGELDSCRRRVQSSTLDDVCTRYLKPVSRHPTWEFPKIRGDLQVGETATSWYRPPP